MPTGGGELSLKPFEYDGEDLDSAFIWAVRCIDCDAVEEMLHEGKWIAFAPR